MSCDELILEIEAAFDWVRPWPSGPLDESSIEPWSHLDAKSFRSHLPAAMVRVLRGNNGDGLCWWLTLPLSGDEEIHLHKWSALDPRQRACVRKFLLHMAVDDPDGRWEEACEGYWDTAPLS